MVSEGGGVDRDLTLDPLRKLPRLRHISGDAAPKRERRSVSSAKQHRSVIGRNAPAGDWVDNMSLEMKVYQIRQTCNNVCTNKLRQRDKPAAQHHSARRLRQRYLDGVLCQRCPKLSESIAADVGDALLHWQPMGVCAAQNVAPRLHRHRRVSMQCNNPTARPRRPRIRRGPTRAAAAGVATSSWRNLPREHRRSAHDEEVRERAISSRRPSHTPPEPERHRRERPKPCRYRIFARDRTSAVAESSAWPATSSACSRLPGDSEHASASEPPVTSLGSPLLPAALPQRMLCKRVGRRPAAHLPQPPAAGGVEMSPPATGPHDSHSASPDPPLTERSNSFKTSLFEIPSVPRSVVFQRTLEDPDSANCNLASACRSANTTPSRWRW